MWEGVVTSLRPGIGYKRPERSVTVVPSSRKTAAVYS